MTRKAYDRTMKSLVYAGTAFTAVILLAIILFTFSSGTALLSWKLVTGDYYPETHSIEIKEVEEYCDCEYEGTIDEDSYYSPKWGIMLTDTEDTEGKTAIKVTFVDVNSPFRETTNLLDNSNIEIVTNSYISGGIRTNDKSAYVSDKAEIMISVLESATEIETLGISIGGGGIRGSIVSTLYLIVFTLIIAVPFGVLTAIYMKEYGNKGRVLKTLSTMIDMLTGVPSIIFGLLGAAIFIPFVNNVKGVEGYNGSIIAGALTMSVILLPVIVKTTTEALSHVPRGLRDASYALGANKTQTTFKVVLPNSIPGIISGIILGIGRIVGESAALIFAMGTLISDNPGLFDRSTSLAVHIWSVMAGESPNFELASAIALIILIVVLILNLAVKQIAKKFDKMNKA